MVYPSLYNLAILLIFQPSVDNLASENYQTREAAEATLTRWVDFCWPLLDRRFTDLEQRKRAERILRYAIPNSPPPIGLLSSSPMLEWVRDGNECGTIVSYRPGTEWQLGWINPLPNSYANPIIRYYGERARTQYKWQPWHSDKDGRSATTMLCKDLQLAGCPLPLIRCLVWYLEMREVAVFYPPEKYRMERVGD